MEKYGKTCKAPQTSFYTVAGKIIDEWRAFQPSVFDYRMGKTSDCI
jgi:hypothetical protein